MSGALLSLVPLPAIHRPLLSPKNAWNLDTWHSVERTFQSLQQLDQKSRGRAMHLNEGWENDLFSGEADS